MKRQIVLNGAPLIEMQAFLFEMGIQDVCHDLIGDYLARRFIAMRLFRSDIYRPPQQKCRRIASNIRQIIAEFEDNTPKK